MMSKLTFKFLIGFSALIFIIAFSSCYKTNYYSGDDLNLRFSSDTLVFDTVFTSVGSATRVLKIYNDREQAIELSSVYLEETEASRFRINVDGLMGPIAENVEIGPNDSIYIFSEVTIDPDQPLSESPFIIDDHIVFESNGGKQKVLLEAWGQNANYLPGKFAKGKAYIKSCDLGEETWDDPKPYVIYGTLLIDSCRINIPAGTRIYIHGGYAKSDSGLEYNDGQLYFLQHGSINVTGTADEPVIFQTDRLEHKYDDISGLWSGLYFINGSSNNRIEYAELKNANIGIYLDSAVEMEIHNTKILHNITAGIYAKHATLKAVNCLIADSGGYGLAFRYGGNYQLDYCTIANYDNQEEAIYMGNYQCRDYLCTELDVFAINASFRNCVFYGNGGDELFFENALPDDPDVFNYTMDNCLIAVDEILETDAFKDLLDHCSSCLEDAGENKLFIDIDNYNFHPDTLSVLIGKGISIPEITIDLDDNNRDMKPDIGCYEVL